MRRVYEVHQEAPRVASSEDRWLFQGVSALRALYFLYLVLRLYLVFRLYLGFRRSTRLDTQRSIIIVEERA